MMRHFPIFLDLEGKSVLVVGAAAAAATKADQLARAGACVRHVLDFEGLGYAVLVVCADPDPALGSAVAIAARAARIPVNVVDRPELCDFIWPSIIERGPVTVAVSTGGQSPVLARMLKTRIETAVPSAYGRLAEFAGELRARVARAIPDISARRRFWERMLGGAVGERVLAGNEAEARQAFDRALLGAESHVGHVSFVDVAADDPDLLVLRAVRRLQDADVVVHDEAVDPCILNLARRDAERLAVAHIEGLHTRSSANAASLLGVLARCGKRVVRLQCRASIETGQSNAEIDAIAEMGIGFDVVQAPAVARLSRQGAATVEPLVERRYR